jgi:hypothetical protein
MPIAGSVNVWSSDFAKILSRRLDRRCRYRQQRQMFSFLSSISSSFVLFGVEC